MIKGLLIKENRKRDKSFMRFVSLYLMAAFMGFVVSSCGNNQKSADQEKPDISASYDFAGEDVDVRRLDILEEPILGKPIVMMPGGYQQIRVAIVPENHNEMILWSSSDDTVVRVSQTGRVEAIRKGVARIIATSERSGVSDTAVVSVEGESAMPVPTTEKPANSVKPVKKIPSKPTASSGSKNLGYATFRGSWPNDVKGRMDFISSHVIDSRDPKGRIAEAGDYVIGEWSEGHLVQGVWYGADHQVKGRILIGK